MFDEVQGTSLGKHGWCVSVMGIRDEDISMGKISEEVTGMVVFHIKYSALLFRPYVHEVLDAVVSDVSQVCDGHLPPLIIKLCNMTSWCSWVFLQRLGHTVLPSIGV